MCLSGVKKKGKVAGKMREYMLIVFIWNLLIWLLYGLDKLFAKRKLRRISEKYLLITALLFGGAGAMFGMVIFNHKTSKLKFRILVPLMLVLQAFFIWSLL